MDWSKASTMFFGSDAFNQSIGAWNMSAVTNMGGCSMELLPPPSRLVPGTHQQWLVRWWNSILHALYTMFENKVTWHTIHVLPSTYIYCTWFIIVVFRRKVQLSQLLVLWFAVWSCFQQPLAMLKCSMPQWAGGRQAPCSLVLMPSSSPLGPGTCQQWPTWGDVPWSYCHHPADWCLERISSDWCGGGTVYCMLCIQCFKTKLPGIQYMSSLLHIFIVHDLLM